MIQRFIRVKKTLYGAGVLFWCVLQIASVRAETSATGDLSSYINPFVGTDRGGDTFPGAVAPFGLVQLTPNWENNGYYYTDSHMHGFVVNSLSGDGGANEGEVLMTATTGPVKADRPNTDYAFDHRHESAAAGYYQVLMQPWNINAELTASAHCGCIRYTFPAGPQANIVLPLSHANTKVLESHVHLIDAQTVEGSVTCESFNGLRRGITAYFVMRFSQPFARYGTSAHGAVVPDRVTADSTSEQDPISFYGSYAESSAPKVVTMCIGVSYVDKAGALANLKAEMPDFNFDAYRRQTAALWNHELSTIQVQGGTETHKRIFYTALYHSLISPLVFDDVDGRYRGFDDQIHHVENGHHFYADFSGWDIYRSEVPLLALIEPRRVEDMAQSLVEVYKQIGFIDRWLELNRATAIMNGDPLTIALAHIWNAGLHDFDLATAYKAMFAQAAPGQIAHLGDYEGYEEERNGLTISPDSSVSSALEHFDAFAALALLARSMDKTSDAFYLTQRAMDYRKWYNPSSGFFQRHNAEGAWDDKFNGYTEGNRWIYLWFVPEDVQGLIDLLGGDDVFEARLDDFFQQNRYDPTNEPDLQAPFLYDYINRPWKTQALVAQTADRMFTDEPGGLAGGGNDDLGTMSAWYILSQLGFYPVDPAVPYFEVCTPRFAQATIRLQPPYSGKQFVIKAPDAAPDNLYIQSSTLNGQSLVNPWFPESAITQGGTWNVNVGTEPDKSRDRLPFDPPSSLSTGFVHRSAFTESPPLAPIVPTGQEGSQTWRYTTSPPKADWFSSSFDDASWPQGMGGFGTEDVGVTPRTSWNTDDLWARQSFDLPSKYSHLTVVAYHDQGIEIYVNGKLIGQSGDWVHSYQAFPLDAASLKVLKSSGNVLAIHVHHPGTGRHFADAGVTQRLW